MIGEKFKTFLKKDKNIFGCMRNLIYFYIIKAITLRLKKTKNYENFKTSLHRPRV